VKSRVGKLVLRLQPRNTVSANRLLRNPGMKRANNNGIS